MNAIATPRLARSRRPSHPPLPRPEHAARVLIAEDDKEMRAMLAEQLREEGYLVEAVEDGAELADRVGSAERGDDDDRPDVIVSDVRMPGRSGLEVLGALRRRDWGMPVVLITAFGDRGVHEAARRLGAALVLDKPFDVDELIHAVRAIAPPRL